MIALVRFKAEVLWVIAVGIIAGLARYLWQSLS
jgi:hypothetical protein